jgi:adenylate kinase
MNLILVGAQGSGKGTQAQLLSEEFHLKPLASGDLLRDAIAQGTQAGLAAKPYYDRGDLAPDDIVVEMILEAMRDLGDAHGIILDGFPRTIPQAQVLDERLRERGRRIDAVIYLNVPRETLLDRLSGRYICRAHGHVWNVKTHPPRVAGICDYDGSELYQRSDDTGEKIARRLDIFFHETIQLLPYYHGQGKLIQVDGTGDVQSVTANIVARLRTLRVAAGSPGNADEHPAGTPGT